MRSVWARDISATTALGGEEGAVCAGDGETWSRSTSPALTAERAPSSRPKLRQGERPTSKCDPGKFRLAPIDRAETTRPLPPKRRRWRFAEAALMAIQT